MALLAEGAGKENHRHLDRTGQEICCRKPKDATKKYYRYIYRYRYRYTEIDREMYKRIDRSSYIYISPSLPKAQGKSITGTWIKEEKITTARSPRKR